MIFAGLDIGSRSMELVLLQKGRVVEWRKTDTGYDPLGQASLILEGLSWDSLTATGYGRKLISDAMNAQAITEIQAHALGVRELFPEARTILDIGGQDTKAMALLPNGKISRFEMNDRCAAGTGKFLEFMATSLSQPLEEFGGFALTGRPGVAINSMCTVFAETEATSLMAKGCKAADIALALHHSVVRRSLSMLKRVGLNDPVVFTGGVARNPCMVKLLEQDLAMSLCIPENPEMTGALGAALYGASNARAHSTASK
ncbi:CoA-substrate-specific enzyme activase, putative [Desulfatibacillum alkenivorans DSM 16219]|jgi:predicted CoA-substrate-specific enzyme activase|uniref:CoA-substrate-specific enzyme activase, putative n=1 Tax=Desulfatibacillum alkenivorans DSM 16219 TaxID=1121393 RepID=A0A1M6X500_9BACT|nr:acyl-CoA dehydratase activase [Desulfatibacillum alkenivorans]SHL00996.1 CoA-substrate-specific enzyme activase, putative [Desulfatibacillum alkenivorans DSM 16219]